MRVVSRRRRLIIRKYIRACRHMRELERQIARNRPLQPVNLANLPDDVFIANFRFPRDMFPALQRAYNIPNTVYSTKTRQHVDWFTALAIVLARLSNAGWWSLLVPLFGRREGTLKTFFYITLRIMYASCRDRIQRPSRTFLTDERLSNYADALRAKGCPYFNVFGFIDGTVYRVCRPTGAHEWQRAIYSGHKKIHGLKWQGINTPDGIIQFLHGPYRGNDHDTSIWRQSGLPEVLDRNFALPPHRLQEGSNETHFMLYGDPGLCMRVSLFMAPRFHHEIL